MEDTKEIAQTIIDNTKLTNDRQLDYMLLIFDSLMTNNRFDVIDEVIGMLDVRKIKVTSVLMALMSSTFPGKTRLKNRSRMCEIIKQILLETKTEKEVKRLIGNLE